MKNTNLRKSLIRILNEGKTPINEEGKDAAQNISKTLEALINAIHRKDTSVVDQRSLDSSTDGEILAQFILGALQSARIRLKDMKGFSRILKRGL